MPRLKFVVAMETFWYAVMFLISRKCTIYISSCMKDVNSLSEEIWYFVLKFCIFQHVPNVSYENMAAE